jgi:EmrB/QacA subfamily drug resistance transporter
LKWMEPPELSVFSRKTAVAITSEEPVEVNQAAAETAGGTITAPAPELAVVIAVALATTLAPLNSTMIAVALPHIMQDFAADTASAGWLITSYLIVMAAVQPIAGKLGDRFGRRRMILGGLMAFAIASLGAAVSVNLPMLIIFRLLQALSGSITLPNGTALLREVVPAQRRGNRFGLVGAVTSFAAASGPLLGGVLVSLGGWRVQFYANLPIVVGALLLGWIAIPRTEAGPAQSKARFDLMGSVLLFLFLGGVAALLSQSKSGLAWWLIGCGAVGLAAVLALFVWHERRYSDPVVNLGLFGRKAFASASSCIALSNLSMYVMLLAIPLLLAQRPGWTSDRTGLVLAVLFGATVLFSPVGGRLADRLGRRLPTTLGLGLMSVGVVWLTVSGAEVSLPELISGLALAGVGIGLSGAGLQTSAIEAVGPKEAGMAAGVYSTSRYFGSIVGSSVLAGLLASANSFGLVFLLVSVAAVLAALLSLGLPSRPRQEALHVSG